jgi:hypothetical protein
MRVSWGFPAHLLSSKTCDFRQRRTIDAIVPPLAFVLVCAGSGFVSTGEAIGLAAVSGISDAWEGRQCPR